MNNFWQYFAKIVPEHIFLQIDFFQFYVNLFLLLNMNIMEYYGSNFFNQFLGNMETYYLNSPKSLFLGKKYVRYKFQQ